ncbi:MAG TPA: cytochrome c [Gammaproteobacteria bacterium]
MKFFVNMVLGVSMLGTAHSAVAGDVAAGEAAYSAKGCMGCHGPAGNSPNPAMFPKTSGLEEGYLVTQLKAFRSGERSNPMMSPMANGLTDEEIANLSAYLAAQK